MKYFDNTAIFTTFASKYIKTLKNKLLKFNHLKLQFYEENITFSFGIGW